MTSEAQAAKEKIDKSEYIKLFFSASEDTINRLKGNIWQHRRGQVEEAERAARGRHGHFGHSQRRVGPGLRAGGGGVGGPGKGVEASPG